MLPTDFSPALTSPPTPSTLRPVADLALAARLLRTCGYVLLQDALDPALVERLRAQVTLELAGQTPETAGFRRGRLMRSLGHQPAFLDPGLVARPVVLTLMRALLGEQVRLHLVGVDCNFPGSVDQPVHMDCPYLFPETPVALPPFCYAMNVQLIDTTEEFGPLEIWPGGTHLNLHDVDQQEIAPFMPSIRVLAPAGSILLRDIRTWHRGTAHRAQRPRPMLACGYSRPWYAQGIKLPSARYRALPPAVRALCQEERSARDDGSSGSDTDPARSAGPGSDHPVHRELVR